jgi:Xaa-Pro aminopeptidase
MMSTRQTSAGRHKRREHARAMTPRSTAPTIMSGPRARREALYPMLGGGVALLIAAPDLFSAMRSHRYDPTYFPQEHKQELAFYYLSGIEEAGAALLIDGANRTTTLYRTADTEMPSAELSALGLFAAKPRTALVHDLRGLAARRPTLYLLLGAPDERIEGGILMDGGRRFPDGLGQPSDEQQDLRNALEAQFAWMEFDNLEPLVAKLRVVKDRDEIARIRHAARIASEAMKEILRSIRVGVWESELSGVSRFVCRRHGAQRIGYSEDIQSGPSGHMTYWDFFSAYDKHDRVLKRGDLVFVDAACEYRYYQSDMARTVPASGVFSAPHRRVYMLYMQAYDAALRSIRPGATQREIALAFVSTLNKSRSTLRDRYLVAALEDAIERYKTGEPLGHFVDMYVYGSGDPAQPLVPGQVLTIEPVMMLPAPHPGRITVEDLVLVTDTGHDVLTRSVPRSPASLERLMAEEGLLDWYARSRPRRIHSAPASRR